MAKRGGDLTDALRFISSELERHLNDPKHWDRCQLEREALVAGSHAPRWCRRFTNRAAGDMFSLVAEAAMRQAILAQAHLLDFNRPGAADLVLHAAMDAADRVHADARDRFGPLAKLAGMHDLRHAQRRRGVLKAWQAGNDMRATAKLSGVSLAAAYRIVNKHLSGNAEC